MFGAIHTQNRHKKCLVFCTLYVFILIEKKKRKLIKPGKIWLQHHIFKSFWRDRSYVGAAGAFTLCLPSWKTIADKTRIAASLGIDFGQ
jgi:hypothetical protein